MGNFLEGIFFLVFGNFREGSLENALRMVTDQHTAHVATASGINTSLLSYILKLAFVWIFQQIQS